jgi:hypothetical protein
MRAKWIQRLMIATALAWLVAAGCESKPEPTALSAQLELERAQAAPVVSGPHEEIRAKGEVPALAKAVQAAFADSKIEVVRLSEPNAGQWFLGKSLAGRQVLVQILPVVPQQAVIKITVEGGDQVTQELLARLAADITRATR